MPVFEYKAVDKTGRVVTGTLFSTSLSSAADELTKRELNVQHVAVASQTNDPIPRNFTPRKPEAPREEEPKPPPVPIAPTVDPPTTARSKIVSEVISPLV